jgi:hypothetical protein
MLALGAERRSPFQMRPIQNPFSRAVSAVENFRDQVVANVREVGTNITHRIQRTQVATIDSSKMTSPVDVRRVQDAAQLERARATIATEAHKPSIKKAIIHNAVEATKNSAPAVVVGAVARLSLGAGLGLQTLAVASGASAVSRGVREATFTIRKGAFAETTKLITKHEEAVTLTNFDGSERVAHTGLRATQDRFAQTGIGKVTNALLHGGEKKIAEFAYGKHRHARALINAQYKEVSCLSDKELIKLREHAVMARITNGTASDVYATRQLAKSTYQTVNCELSKRGIDRREAHERQLRLYRNDVRIGAGINVVGQASLAAVKAIPKTFATFFITDAFLKAINVDTSNRHNPLEGFENTRLGRAIGNAIAPKSVASAEELSPGMPHITQPVSISVISDQTSEAQRFGSPDPRLTTTVHIENGKTIITSTGVLSYETPKPVMPAPVEAPRAPSFVRISSVDRVAHAPEVNVVAPMHGVARTVLETQEYTIDGKVSWTQDIFDRRLLSGMQDSAHSMDWYGAPGTAGRMVKEVFAVNPDLMDADDMQEMQEYLATHPNASFVQMWKDLQHTVFSDDMDKLTDGTAYKVLSEHTVVVQDPIAEVNEEDAIVMGARRASKPPGLAKLAQSTDQQTAPPTPPSSVRMSNEEYLAMRQAVASGQPVHASGGTSIVTPNGGTLTSEQYLAQLAMTRNSPSVIPTSPVSVGSSGNGNVSVEEYQRLIAQTQQVNTNLGEAVVNNPTTVHNPRMDINEYLRIQRETAAKAAEAARASNQMDPQEYMRRVAEINARNDGVVNVNATPMTQWEAPQVASTWLDPRQEYVSTFNTSNPHFNMSNLSIPAYDLNHPDSAAYNAVTAYINSLGGYNIELHSGELNAYGVQAFEPIRDYLQGGAAIPRLGPAQEAYRAQQLINEYTYLDVSVGSRDVGGAITAFHHVTVTHPVENVQLVVPRSDLDGIIGGGPDITALTGCSRGHVQAIQMLLDAERNAPAELSQHFAVLRDPRAEGDTVEKAVSAIVNQWYINSADYADFMLLYGYLDPSELANDAKWDELEANGYFTAGRLVFDLINNGGA